MICYKHIIVVW